MNMQTNLRRKWQHFQTVQRLEIIRQNLDKPDAQIALLLGISRSAVHDLRKRYKIAKVHGTIQNRQRRIQQIRKLKPGLSAKAAALQLGLSVPVVTKYARLAGYQLIKRPVARHLYWRERLKELPPLLTISAVARKLGVTYGHAALLCYRHKYKATVLNGRRPARVPIRNYLKRPKHERWLASLKSRQV